MEIKCECDNCGMDLEPSHVGICPHCGKAAGKTCKAIFQVAIGLQAISHVEKTHTTIEFHTKPVGATALMLTVDIIILIVCSLIGLWIGNGFIGFAVGFIVSLIAIFIVDICFKRKEKNTIHEIIKYQ